MTESLVDVALLAYGGPESPEQIVPFLERLMGRTPDPGTVAAVKERYALIGGASPLPGITARQAKALQAKLVAGARLPHPRPPRLPLHRAERRRLRALARRARGRRAAHEPLRLAAHERQVQGAAGRRRGPDDRRPRPRRPAPRGLVREPGLRADHQPARRRGARRLRRERVGRALHRPQRAGGDHRRGRPLRGPAAADHLPAGPADHARRLALRLPEQGPRRRRVDGARGRRRGARPRRRRAGRRSSSSRSGS